jgi:phage terminase large subunit-like protein
MMALGVGEAEQKLDRADALVWALTGLLLGPVRLKPRIGLL